MEKSILLTVENLTVERNGHVILNNVSFSVDKGDTLAIIGPNGAGKTTLFKAILDFIEYDGKVIWKEGIKIGYVPQKLYIDNDLPITTREFFALKENHKSKMLEVLEAVGLSDGAVYNKNTRKHILDNRLSNLSGGELQRVIIAWSLLGSPDILLFDEPTAGVDIAGEETIYSLLEKLKQKHQLTILLISHEIDIVRHFTSKVLCLNKEQVCFGSPLETITKDTIDKLFGEETNLYRHTHKH